MSIKVKRHISQSLRAWGAQARL